MNPPPRLFSDGSLFIDRLTQDIHDATERLLTDGYGNRCPGVADGQTTLESIRGSHRNGSDDAIAQLLLNLKHETFTFDAKSIIDFRQ